MKIKELTEKFYEIEKELNLIEQQIMGVYFWKLIRFNIYYKLTREIAGYEQAFIELKLSEKQLEKQDQIKSYNANNHSYIARKNPVDILVFESARRANIDGIYREIYTYKKIQELEDNNISYEIVERSYLLKYSETPSLKRSYFDDYGDEYKKHRSSFELCFNLHDYALIKTISSKIFDIFNVSFNLKEQVESSVRGFLIRKTIIKNALLKRKVKKIYIVVSYGLDPIIAAAQELNIECIEIQHGAIYYYDAIYSFPYNKKVPYFPDKIELFGNYWKETAHIPLPKDKLVSKGYPYLREQLKKYPHLIKNNNKITMVSQGTIGKKLSDYAYQLALNNPNLEIVYKLHPGEFDRWKDSYTGLLKSKELPNFKIIQDEKNIYELLLTSKYIFGVYSTTIFEALEAGCKVFLVDLPGVDRLDNLVLSNLVTKISPDNYKQINLDGYKTAGYYKGYFFK